MYKMDHYTGHEREEVLSFMRKHSFAMVTSAGDDYPVASHLPLEIVEDGDKLFLTGHLMKKTDHHRAFEKNENVLVVFLSPHAYINAAWYENKAQASTVNYMAVHARGKISFTDDAGTLEAIKQLTDKHIGTESPASFSSISKSYVDNMLKAIVGFSIEVFLLENVFKLSQNRDKVDQAAIIQQLKERNHEGDRFIANEMNERL
jgi:transcriptional regulator